MTISKRLIMVIAIAAAALLFTSIFGLIQNKRVFDAANFANVNTVPSIVVLNRAQLGFFEIRVLMHRHVILADEQKKLQAEQQIQAAADEVKKAFKEYESLLANDEDKKFLDSDQSAFAEYSKLVDQTVTLSRQNKQQDAMRAIDSAFSVGQKLSDTLAKHVKLNVDLGLAAAADAEATEKFSVIALIGVALAAVVIVLAIGLQVRRLIVNKLEKCNVIAGEIANGNLSVRIEETGSKDEIGQLMASMEKMRLALVEILTQITNNSSQLADSSKQLATTSQQVSISTDNQASSTASAAAAIEQLTVSIDHVGNSTDDVNKQAIETGSQARASVATVQQTVLDMNKVNEQVEHTAEQMQQLAQQLARIGNITTVISDVAEQTNLLALNAAIEAARAGEQGRGFAVVADEVRKLAERTSNSVKEITAMVTTIQSVAASAVESMHSSQKVAEQVVSAANQIGLAMSGIQTSTISVQEAISSVSDALREQRGASTELAQNIESIAQMSEENSAAVATVSQTAKVVEDIAKQLQSQISRFRI